MHLYGYHVSTPVRSEEEDEDEEGEGEDEEGEDEEEEDEGEGEEEEFDAEEDARRVAHLAPILQAFVSRVGAPGQAPGVALTNHQEHWDAMVAERVQLRHTRGCTQRPGGHPSHAVLLVSASVRITGGNACLRCATVQAPLHPCTPAHASPDFASVSYPCASPRETPLHRQLTRSRLPVPFLFLQFRYVLLPCGLGRSCLVHRYGS